jgi:hypothetical protein
LHKRWRRELWKFNFKPGREWFRLEYRVRLANRRRRDKWRQVCFRRYFFAGQNDGRLVRIRAGFDRPEFRRVVKIRPKNRHYFFRIFRNFAMRALAAALPFFNFAPRLLERFFRRFVPAFAFFLLRRRPPPPPPPVPNDL